MPEIANAKVRKLLLQQRALAVFGGFALAQTDLMTILTEAARVCAEGLDVPFCKICRYRPEEGDLLVEAGWGWKEGVVGRVVSRADGTSPQGRAFATGHPAVCNDLRADTGFVLPSLYAEHGILSTIDVVIKGSGKPYGILEIDNDRPQNYDQHDIDFLTGFANVLAEAVATAERSRVINATVTEMKLMLEQKDTLAEELQHRVRNSLQLIHGMLTREVDEGEAKAALRAIARRVSTLAQVYDHLLGNGMTRTTDLGAFVTALCRGLGASLGGLGDAAVRLSCDAESLPLDLDVVTALGLVVSELVTNGYEHAFPDRRGSIRVSLRRPGDANGMGTLIVADDGVGYTPAPSSTRHGISVVRRLVEQVGGTVTVNSVPGTRWTVEFPAAAA